MKKSNYDKSPFIPVSNDASACKLGWAAVCGAISEAVSARNCSKTVLAIECYPGVFEDEIFDALQNDLPGAMVLRSASAFLEPAAIDRLVAPDLGGEDPIFGRMSDLSLSEFFDPLKREKLQSRIAAMEPGLVIVLGTGAILCCEPDLVIYADLPRWEAQLRQRRNEIANLGVENHELKASLQYKRSFFIDWRVCDKIKHATMARWDFLLETCTPAKPKLVFGDAFRDALRQSARRPFRLVPFFDPGPWGGQWMRRVCDLPEEPPNYAWCFDCVPEENSLVLGFGDLRVEVPALDLVYFQSEELLGKEVYARFGPEFPIRFDLLDTMEGGNLSLQVHPDTEFARENFGLTYTQDESYYLLDAGPDAVVYLGCKNKNVAEEMLADLDSAATGQKSFDASRFAASFPASKHDHFLIPAGTLHCSGANSMVLEISATPYIFTFKLWDWNRLGLDGLPRPMNLERAKKVIRWERDEHYARKELMNRTQEISRGDGWIEQRTGLHESQFIETRRHWFMGKVNHDTHGMVNVLNLVEGDEVTVESPTSAFEPFIVHYAETFVVPAAVGAYTIQPSGPSQGTRCATLKAFVRAIDHLA